MLDQRIMDVLAGISYCETDGGTAGCFETGQRVKFFSEAVTLAAYTALGITNLNRGNGSVKPGQGETIDGGVPGAPNGVERIVVKTNSAGESVVQIQGKEMSIHASQQSTRRGISNESIAKAMDQQPFSYVQNGQKLQGYYDAASNTFVGVGDRITTVIRPRNPQNYIDNIRNR